MDIDIDKLKQYIISNILPIRDKFVNYNLVISGPIGAGKSTIIKELHELFEIIENFECQIIPEYLEIDTEFSKLLLDRFIDSKISHLTMQLSILDVYKSKLISVSPNYNIRLFERIPDDNLCVFTNVASEFIGDLGVKLIFDKTMEINKYFNIPSYCLNNIKFKKIVAMNLNEILLIILQTIKSDIISGIKNRMIGLSISLEISELRIKLRSRDCEQSYDRNYLNQLITTYENIYTELSKPNYKINLLNMGKLIN